MGSAGLSQSPALTPPFTAAHKGEAGSFGLVLPLGTSGALGAAFAPANTTARFCA